MVPLLGFIDEKCIIFDTEEENKFEYSHIHEEFKHQVDAMLTEFLEELGVSPEDFLSVVQNRSSGLNSFVVNSILVVDDFQLFKAMMVKRNMDLTKEASWFFQKTFFCNQLGFNFLLEYVYIAINKYMNKHLFKACLHDKKKIECQSSNSSSNSALPPSRSVGHPPLGGAVSRFGAPHAPSRGNLPGGASRDPGVRR